ncbi:MAG: hypothetical protein RL238_2352 [Actinomycetota bacterium]
MTPLRVGITAACWLLLWGALAVADAQPDPLLLAALVTVLAVGVVVLRDLVDTVEHVEWVSPFEVGPGRRGRDARVDTLRRQLDGAPWMSRQSIGDVLVEIIDDRLLAHHDVDRYEDPAAANALLTPRLRRVVADPGRAAPILRDVNQIIDDIEAL